MTYRLAVLGGGKMGTALVQGLLSSGWATPDELLVTEILSHRRDSLSEELFGVDVLGSLDGVEIDAAVIAVKPGDVATAASAAAQAGATRLLSIAAGVPTRVVERSAPGVRVVRAMPNTPALVGAGAAAIAPGRGRERGRPGVGRRDPACGGYGRPGAGDRARRGDRPLRVGARPTCSSSPRR